MDLSFEVGTVSFIASESRGGKRSDRTDDNECRRCGSLGSGCGCELAIFGRVDARDGATLGRVGRRDALERQRNRKRRGDNDDGVFLLI